MPNMTYAAQGNLTIYRLRNGDTFTVSFDLNGKPLYQGIDPETGTIKPDWTVAANQPIITPVVTSARGGAVSLSLHRWYYNNDSQPLNFNGTTVGGWTPDSTGKFALRASDGSIKIIANLASTVNTANDTLKYTCQATLEGVEYNLSKTVDIIIQNIGASSYFGWLDPSTKILDSNTASATVTAHLMLAGEELTTSNFYCKWYKDVDLVSAWNGQSTVTITRGDINGTQVFLCKFFKSSSDTTPVFTAAITMTDLTDEFKVVPRITSSNTSVSEGNNVVVKAEVVRMRDNSVYSLANATSVTWASHVMGVRNNSDWTVIRTVASDTVTISTSDTDHDGRIDDIVVVQEVEWVETI